MREFAPLNEKQGCSFRPYKNLAKKFEGEIEFDYLQFGEDDAALQQSNPGAFCLKTCNKLGRYLQLTHNIDMVRMQVEFY